MTLKQLRIFLAVAHHQSHTLASRQLFMSQPAVSMQIRQLEENLGISLFNRVGKKIQLSDAGQEMVHYARSISSQAEEAKEVMLEFRDMKKGHLHLTMASTANYFAPKLLASFCDRYPGVQMSLNVTNRAGLLQALEDNTTDIVIMGAPPKELPLASEVFMDNPLVVIAAPDHDLAHQKYVSLAQLAKEPFIIREKNSGTRAAVERFLARHNIERPSGMGMNSNEAIKQAVQAGLGLGVVSSHTLEMELLLKRLCVLPVQDFPIMRHWRVVYRQDRHFSKVAHAFKDFICEEAASILQSKL